MLEVARIALDIWGVASLVIFLGMAWVAYVNLRAS